MGRAYQAYKLKLTIFPQLLQVTRVILRSYPPILRTDNRGVKDMIQDGYRLKGRNSIQVALLNDAHESFQLNSVTMPFVSKTKGNVIQPLPASTTSMPPGRSQARWQMVFYKAALQA